MKDFMYRNNHYHIEKDTTIQLQGDIELLDKKYIIMKGVYDYTKVHVYVRVGDEQIDLIDWIDYYVFVNPSNSQEYIIEIPMPVDTITINVVTDASHPIDISFYGGSA